MISDTKGQSGHVDPAITLPNDEEVTTLEFGKLLKEVGQSEVVIVSDLENAISEGLNTEAFVTQLCKAD